MSVDRHVYVGPFAACKVGKPAKVEVSRWGCPSCKEGKGVSAVYCDACGTKCSYFKTKEEGKAVEPQELCDRMKDNLFVPYEACETGVCVYAPNINFGAGRSMDFDPDEYNGVQELSAALVSSETVKFREKFAKELGVLRNAYGASNVSVTWGLLVWCN